MVKREESILDTIEMPTNRDHKKGAMMIGVGPTLGKQVDRMLDYPVDPLTGKKMDHREIHDMKGIMMAYMMFGYDGAKAAMMHILMDMFFDESNRTRDMALYGRTYRQQSHR